MTNATMGHLLHSYDRKEGIGLGQLAERVHADQLLCTQAGHRSGAHHAAEDRLWGTVGAAGHLPCKTESAAESGYAQQLLCRQAVDVVSQDEVFCSTLGQSGFQGRCRREATRHSARLWLCWSCAHSRHRLHKLNVPNEALLVLLGVLCRLQKR